jgi:hypothetical protein
VSEHQRSELAAPTKATETCHGTPQSVNRGLIGPALLQDRPGVLEGARFSDRHISVR